MKARIEIRIWSNDDQPSNEDMPALFVRHVAHVAELLQQDYCCGQICDDYFTGWWEIIT